MLAPSFLAVAQQATIVPRPLESIVATLLRLSRIFFCPESSSFRMESRSAELSSPSTILPSRSRIVELPLLRSEIFNADIFHLFVLVINTTAKSSTHRNIGLLISTIQH